MRTIRPLAALLFALLFALPVAAQVHTRSAFILGNTAELRCTAPPGSPFGAFVLSFAGLGTGPCLPPQGCLAVRAPLLVSSLLPVSAAAELTFSFVIPAALPPAPLATQGVVFAPAGLLTSNALDGPIEPLSSFDDAFSGNALASGWQIHNAHLLQHSVSGGELHMQPTAGGPPPTWFADGEGPMVFAIVRGDFSVTAAVRSYRPSDPSLPPPANYNMGGLCVRDPRSTPGDHDWMHLAIGGGIPGTEVVVETKTTADSTSVLTLYPVTQPQGELRITRQGDTFTLWHRPDALAAWTLYDTFVRPDIGPQVQVGPHVFSWSPTVDIAASFDWVAFTRP